MPMLGMPAKPGEHEEPLVEAPVEATGAVVASRAGVLSVFPQVR